MARRARAGTSCSRARSSRTSARSRRERAGRSRSRTTSTRASPPRSSRQGISGALRPPGGGVGGAVRRGEHVIVTTGTASGKSLAFNLPVLDLLAREPKSRALYLYPTKALAQDQARALGGVRAEGRQAGDLRRRHRDRAALADPALGERDPDEPRHAPRRRPPPPRPLGRRAREPRASSSSTRRTSTAASSARTSRNVLRRLRRLARAYGSEPQFVLASATIANPARAGASRCSAMPATVIDSDARAARRADDRALEPAS